MQTHPWVERGQQQVRFGVLSQSHGDWPRFRQHARRVEAMGFDAIWVYDHPLSFGSADCWIALSELARATTTIRLGSSVSCVSYRHPVVLARMAADVDQLSNGRLLLGLGIGDDPVEFGQLGIPFGQPGPRQHLLEETVRAVRELWTGQPVTLRGEAVRLENAQLLNGPLQPHVPILIAGGGERVTLRQVADLADACNFGPYSWTGSAYTKADVERKYAALRAHCDAAERPYDSVLRTYYTMLVLAESREQAEAVREAVPTVEEFRSQIFAGTAEDAIAHYQALVDLGVQYFIAWLPPGDERTLRLLAEEVMPALVTRGWTW